MFLATLEGNLPSGGARVGGLTALRWLPGSCKPTAEGLSSLNLQNQKKTHMCIDVAIRNSKHVFKGLRRNKDGETVPAFSLRPQHKLGCTVWDWISWGCSSVFLTHGWSPRFQPPWQSPHLPYFLPRAPSELTFSMYPHMPTRSSCQLCVCLCRCVKDDQPVWVRTFSPVDGLFTSSDQLISKNTLLILTLNHNNPLCNLYSYNSVFLCCHCGKLFFYSCQF